MTKDPRVKVTQTQMGASAGLLYISPEIADAETRAMRRVSKSRSSRDRTITVSKAGTLPARILAQVTVGIHLCRGLSQGGHSHPDQTRFLSFVHKMFDGSVVGFSDVWRQSEVGVQGPLVF